MANANDTIELEGFVKQQKELEALLMSNPHMEKAVQGLIRKVLAQARKQIGESARSSMKSDPRQAYKAVKVAVYSQILGGNVSLFSKRRASKTGSTYEAPSRLRPGQRGGNRRPRSGRTNQLAGYAGNDRGFILRWLEAGTNGRGIHFTFDEARQRVNRGSRGGNLRKYGKTINTGTRGRIAPRNFFGASSRQAMETATKQLVQLIDELIRTEIK